MARSNLYAYQLVNENLLCWNRQPSKPYIEVIYLLKLLRVIGSNLSHFSTNCERQVKKKNCKRRVQLNISIFIKQPSALLPRAALL